MDSDSTIIEPTSGNTGIGLAFVCARLRLRLILTMPESMSVERRKLLAHLGAELHLSPAAEGMQGAMDAACHLLATTENSYMPDQFSNPANPAIHRETTAEEIWQQSGGKVDIFIAGIGTGGTFVGVGEGLRSHNPAVSLIAVEPQESPVLSGGAAAPHAIQGIGANFVPSIFRPELADEILPVQSEMAIATARELAQQQGFLCGISSGAAVYAAKQVALRPQNRGKTIVTILPDTGERYLSTALFTQTKQR
ncbi:MAG: cysteine synthase A [Gammaproteobacteria bacterium]|nr:MAG: cysteine synthase A [Gammaproteobacteria bacterium]